MTATRVEDFTGAYGVAWTTGVLSEHLHLVAAAGLVVVDGAVDGYPVLCSELIEIATEDGPVVGRCGLPVVDGVSCAGHAAEIAGWRAMTEADKIAWEEERERW